MDSTHVKKIEAMPEPWKSHFPTTDVMAGEWKPLYSVHALSSKVLCVAKTRIEGAWSAYCDAVPGIKHSDEYHGVLDYGTKLDERVARTIFPRLNDLPYAK